MNRKQRIEDSLSYHLNSVFLEVIDESRNHHVPEGSETHFKVVIVSPQFQSLSRVERHRLINKLLDSELKNGLHALSMHLHTPAEWDSKQKLVPASPNCLDGYHEE